MTWVRIHQPFSGTFFVFFSKICKSKCNTTSKPYDLADQKLCYINLFPQDKILDQTKLKAFADNLNVTKMIISVFDRVENIVGKGVIACTSNFSFSHNVFKRLIS